MGEIFNTLIINPIVNLLLVFYVFFTKLGIPGSLGFALIGLTVIIRFVLHPFYKQQMDLSKKMTNLKPELETLQKKYKDDKQKLQHAQLQLYKDKGINPAGGCLVGLLQMPFILGLYNALNIFLQGGSIKTVIEQVNKIAYIDFLKISTIDPIFFGFNLAKAPSGFQTLGIHYLMIPVITFYLQYLQGKYTFPTPAKTVTVDGEKKGEDMSQIMSSQMKIMFPLMVGYFSYILPVGLAIYWNVFSLFSVVQYMGKSKSQ
ncbi:hypothetical protein A2690_03305 [Candidatus Roizmanbacteria bacterium RIFCSPHIGHO2_01_FULL_39_12b]|uniref:Membrane insertase YidC/Oxa/ALB C-terminal domain-containing protein n=1 Tax=Candidatus Roizmanbacteria bacterium RIFCSPHIGHO2_01_FULL_39_12b TaxID=1802030 RepID=A0A1F7GCH3_9BACT|nr:MAG: hypothetical protein A2690_03305 [Candidatus Roizmanbacteria bacterium RIFCSPHIGHO2_01_FULL_39_12b]OGK46691.1 MAG: hypothetical protein A3B46_02555 [Candidatus Roizmanbacteria bacterium RIFCSPLOWO2_01_FULL_39_19]